MAFDTTAQVGASSPKMPRQSEESKAKVSFVYSRFTEMKMNREKLGDGNWNKYDDLFQNIPQGAPPEDWMANVFVPFTMSVELAIISEITNQRIRWKVLPKTPDDEERATVIQTITDSTMTKGQWDDEFFRFVHDKIHYGTSVWKEVYREDRRVLRKIIREKGKPNKFEEKDIREFQDVYGYHVPLRNFYLDDRVTARGMREAEDCIERNIMTIDLFRTRYAKYKKSKKVKEWGFIKPDITDEEVAAFPAGGDTTQESLLPIAEMANDQVEVLEYWNKLKDQHRLVANGILVLDEPIPYDHKQLPYAIDICIPVPNSPYGMGIPQTLEAPQEELNMMHNITLDTAKLDIMRPTFMGGMTLLDEDEYQLRPKGIIPVDDVDQIRELSSNGINPSNFQVFEEIKQTIKTAAGLDVRFTESSSSSNKGVETATEIIRQQEASLRRIGLYSKLLQIHALPRIGMLRTMNIQQFYKDPLRVEAMLGKSGEVIMDETTGKPKKRKVFRKIRYQEDGKANYDFMEIKPDMVRADVDVEVVPQSTQPHSQALIAKKVNTALQTVLAFPPALEIIDLGELMKQYFRALDLPTAIVSDIIKGQENDDLNLAQEETEALKRGEKIPPTTNPSLRHTGIHAAAIYQLDPNMRILGFNEQFQALTTDGKQALLDHYTGEVKQHEAKGNVVSSGRTPSPGGTGAQTISTGEELNTQEAV